MGSEKLPHDPTVAWEAGKVRSIDGERSQLALRALGPALKFYTPEAKRFGKPALAQGRSPCLGIRPEADEYDRRRAPCCPKPH